MQIRSSPFQYSPRGKNVLEKQHQVEGKRIKADFLACSIIDKRNCWEVKGNHEKLFWTLQVLEMNNTDAFQNTHRR